MPTKKIDTQKETINTLLVNPQTKETVESLISFPKEMENITILWNPQETVESLVTFETEKTAKGTPKKRKTAKVSAKIVHVKPTHQPHEIIKHIQNPIINPNKDNWWESEQVFNPGVVDVNGKVHIIYRSIGWDGVSRFGYANSEDGFTVDHRISYPVYKHELISQKGQYFVNNSGGSWGGGEDPRLVHIEEDHTIYMTYTACDNGLRVGLASIKTDDFINRRWKWTKPQLISSPNEVNKNWVLFPEKINGKYAILSSITPKIAIEYRDTLNFKRNDFIKSEFRNDETRNDVWDSWVRGAGPPPIKTKYGWLVLYHAMDKFNPKEYLLGAMLLDLEDPTKILYRSKAPIMEPRETYENEGFKAGVIYASGAIVRDENLIIYYGGADSYVCAAYTNLEEFLQNLMKDEKPKIKNVVTKKRVTKKKEIG